MMSQLYNNAGRTSHFTTNLIILQLLFVRIGECIKGNKYQDAKTYVCKYCDA